MNIVKKLCLTTLGVCAFSATAQAADGCKFALCMGAVNPMGIAECAPTVREVMRDLSRGKGLPTCKLSNGADSKTEGFWVDYRRANPVPDCPEGYTQGRDNVVYYTGQKPANANRRSRFQGGAISEKYEDNRLGHIFGDRYKARACIKGNQNGSVSAYTYTRHNGGDREIVKVPRQEWYDEVKLMTPDSAKYEFTFHTDNKPYSKHRF